MYAVEFEADSKGRTIQIPERCKELSDKHLRIIAMFEENSSTAGETAPNWKEDLESVSVWDDSTSVEFPSWPVQEL